MRKVFSVFLLISIAFNLQAQPDVQLRFHTAASRFTEALPLGNGRLGAMVFGGTNRERIVLNEISMWSGGVQDPNRYEARRYLPRIQELLQNENNREAQQLLQQHFVCAGAGSGHGRGAKEKYGSYQILADLFIDWKDTISEISTYTRTLHLDRALATTEWERGGTKYRQEVFVTAPQQVIVIRLTASGKDALQFDLSLDRAEKAVFFAESNILSMKGQLDGGDGDPGIKFATYAKVLAPKGKVTALHGKLRIEESRECMILIGADTDLNWPQVSIRGVDPYPVAANRVEAAAKLSFDELWRNHQEDFSSYFDRCSLKFTSVESDSIKDMNTPHRLVRFANGGRDVSLPALYFNFGRYLLISSSRPGGLPTNLQGLWAEEYQAPWNGDYHLNINVQMNYWPAEITNLADLHLPLIEFVGQLVEPGQKTSMAYYNGKGWVAHVISNPWKFTAPGEGADWGSTPTGGAWLCEHLWQHYLFKPDKKYLEKIYPILKGAAEFFASILIADPRTGWLVTAPSNSPENTYITPDGFRGQTVMGPSMDMQIGRELLSNTIAAARILDKDHHWVDSLANIRERLAPNQISPSTGGVQEWLRDYREAEPQHRHVSHLYGLYPYDEINSETPELKAAAVKTLLRRGDEGTGWSRAWKINFWARLDSGDHALKLLKGLLQPAFQSKDISMHKGAGTYPNLFCAHPPFQIDGNFGGTAGIAEMLLQSSGPQNVIRFLPALPTDPDWQRGEMRGMRARNGFIINFNWQSGKVKEATILSISGKDCYVEMPTGLKVYDEEGKVVTVQSLENNQLKFSTIEGQRYSIR